MDPRFQRASTDPRFRKINKRKVKFSVDSRFKTLFDQDNELFIDKRGHARSDTKQVNQLGKYYNLENNKNRIDYARGEALLESSSDEEEEEEVRNLERNFSVTSSSDDVEVELGADLTRNASIDLDENEPLATSVQVEEEPVVGSEISSRLALVNLDWDHISAIDIHALCLSLLSPSATRDPPLQISERNIKRGDQDRVARGSVESVIVYASEFGKEQMKREEKHGPDLKRSLGPVRDEGNDESLRAYQLQRLRYYYAIVTCDSPRSAQHLYSELDGTEIERTANIIDMRYVPVTMTFDEDDIRDSSIANQLDLNSYDPINFVTDALRHSRSKLTWDDDDADRRKRIARVTDGSSRKMTEEEIEANIRQYIASGSESSLPSDDDEVVGNRRSTTRNLLGIQNHINSSDREDDIHMEVTFAPALSTTSRMETSLQAYRRKEKERGKEKQEQRRREQGLHHLPEVTNPSQVNFEQDSHIQHFDMKEIIKTEKGSKLKASVRKRRKFGALPDDNFVIDTNDARFATLHEDYDLAIDPTHPMYQKTKNMEKLLLEGQRKRSRGKDETGDQDDLADLVSKIKKRHKGNHKKAN